MGDERTLANASAAAGGSFLGITGPALKRLKHALWAGAIALVMLVMTLLDPVDQLIWINQSRMAAHKPSGDIIFVAASEEVEDSAFGHLRRSLAQALINLDRGGVGKVFLDLTFDKPSDSADDATLAKAIADLGPRISIVNRDLADKGGRSRVVTTIPRIAGNANVVVDAYQPNWLGLVWKMSYSHKIHGKNYTTFGAALGGQSPPINGDFNVDYSVFADEIPTTDIGRISNTDDLPTEIGDIAGKTVVIGKGGVSQNTNRVMPGHRSRPGSYVAIFAAETLKAGRTIFISGLPIFIAVFGALITTILFAQTKKRRRFCYYAIVAAIPLLMLLVARLGVRIEASYSIVFLVIFALFRSWGRWKERVTKIDQDTGLPTLRALEEIVAQEEGALGHVVIAKVHGYEHVLKTLRTEDRTTYILKLADRLRAADKELTVYFDGHYLGWHATMENSDALVEHLEGLRAIFAAPIVAGDHTVDVGITFGIARLEGDRLHRIPAAIAAVEETNEASEPIKVAQGGSQIDLLWDLSLRARIDEAMEAGEIYCVYQPKVDISTGAMTGVEALVRWHDPNRGFISPMHFIRQCEKAGRMEHLTRYVLQSACTAGQLLHFRGHPISMSVNISATLLGDMRIVGIVRNVLQATNFKPGSLMLEVTETARISDLATAASILHELKALGPHISIDDFGVGAANFETLFELPFDELKIDRLFIANMVSNPKARAIASSIVAMGKEARITIVAEGVENPEDLEILNEIGCSQVQGYAISRPISLSNLLEFKGMLESRSNRNIV